MSSVTDIVASSALARAAMAAAARIERLYRESHLARAFDQVADAWSAVARPERRFAAGLAIVIAAAVHVALRLLQGVPADWLWLIVPGIAAGQGLLLIAAGRGEAPR